MLRMTTSGIRLDCSAFQETVRPRHMYGIFNSVRHCGSLSGILYFGNWRHFLRENSTGNFTEDLFLGLHEFLELVCPAKRRFLRGIINWKFRLGSFFRYLKMCIFLQAYILVLITCRPTFESKKSDHRSCAKNLRFRTFCGNI